MKDCKLRAWKLEDAPYLAEILNNRRVLDKLRDGLPYPYTEGDAREYIAMMLSADNARNFSFAIVDDDRVVGNIGAFRGENIHFRTAEMGYYIGEPYWGQGIGTCAVKKACEYIFAHSDVVRIFAEPFAYNMASCRVLEKAGFQMEGILRSNAVKNGTVIDMSLYAKIK